MNLPDTIEWDLVPYAFSTPSKEELDDIENHNGSIFHRSVLCALVRRVPPSAPELVFPVIDVISQRP